MSTGAASSPAPSCRAGRSPAPWRRMSAAASSMRCATPCSAASTARCCRCAAPTRPAIRSPAPLRGGHPRPFRRLPRPRDAELHGAARPRRRRDRRRWPTWSSTSWPSPKQLRRSQGARRDRGSRRHPLRRQPAGRGAAAARGDWRRQTALRHRHLAGQGGAAGGVLPGLSCLFMNGREAASLAARRGDPAGRAREKAAGGGPGSRRHHAGSGRSPASTPTGIFTIVPPAPRRWPTSPAPVTRWPASPSRR